VTPALEAAFQNQARTCEALGSPFMGRLLPLIPGLVDPASELGETLYAWPEEHLDAAHDSVPLRFAGGLHLLHLEGAAPALSAVYPPSVGRLEPALRDAIAEHGEALLDALSRPPQTNEVRRAAVLIAAGNWLTALCERPLVVSEIGASAGLNLNWDFFCLQARGVALGPIGSPVVLQPEWRGKDPVSCPPYVAEATGVDINPIDVSDPSQARLLMSYLWPDQSERLARTCAAIALFQAPDTDARLEAGDATAWLPSRLKRWDGHCHLLYSTMAWQYLPSAAQALGEELITSAGAQATPEAPLAWLRMEPDTRSPGAGLLLRLWPGDHTIHLGRVDFHGRWIDWQAPDPTFRLGEA